MRLLRRRPFLRHLALFALAMQLFATFGHVHADPVSHGRTPLEARTFFAPLSKTCLPGLPDHSDCTICAAMSLLGSSAMPQAAPELGVHLHFVGMLSRSDVQAPPDVVTASFQARGPPARILT